jgi:hypothetical protein
MLLSKECEPTTPGNDLSHGMSVVFVADKAHNEIVPRDSYLNPTDFYAHPERVFSIPNISPNSDQETTTLDQEILRLGIGAVVRDKGCSGSASKHTHRDLTDSKNCSRA